MPTDDGTVASENELQRRRRMHWLTLAYDDEAMEKQFGEDSKGLGIDDLDLPFDEDF